MKFVSLLKATSFSGLRVSPFDGVKQYLSTGDLQDNEVSLVDVLYQEKPSRADIFVNEGDILFARMKGTIKVLEITQKLSGIIVSTGFAVIRPNNEFISQYLYFYLKSDAFQRQKDKYCSGAIQPAITNAGLEKIKVPQFSIEIQNRTAYLLTKIEKIIQQRKQSLQQLDDFIKSVFLDMFGDPVKNEKNWKTDSLISFGSFKNGLNFGSSESGITVRYLGIGDFKKKSKLKNINELGYITLNSLPADDYFLKDNDLIFVRSNGNPELVGRCMVVYPNSEKVIYSGFCIRYRINNPDLEFTYIAHLFRSHTFRKMLLQRGQGANIQNINQKILSDLPVPLPPKVLQNKFTTLAEKVEKIKEQYQQSLTELENLYGAISQKAFKGELDLDKIPLIEALQTQKHFDNIDKEQDIQTSNQPKSSLHLYPFLKGVDILTVKGRLELIKFWFEQSIKNTKKGNPLSIEAFWQNAKFNFEQYRDKQLNIAEKNNKSDEVDAIYNLNLGIQEYDFLKALIFEKLADGLLHQELSEVEKLELTQLTRENDLDTKNTIILKK